MTTAELPGTRTLSAADGLPVDVAAALAVDVLLARFGVSDAGLTSEDAAARLAAVGANAVARQRSGLGTAVAAQLRSPLLLLLFVTAVLSAGVGEGTNAVIILVILLASVGLGTANDYRAGRTAHGLAAGMEQRATVRRDGGWLPVPAVEVVPGDIVRLVMGAIVVADLRLLEAEALACDESVLTGEALPTQKSTEAVPTGRPLAELTDCALMGTVVRAGRGLGLVVATGPRTQFGHIAHGLQSVAPQTSFEQGLRHFSSLLARVAITVSVAVLTINLLLGRGLLESVLFATAIAVGITPQLLPAVVSTSLANGARQLGRRKVLVKRLVAIEDLGDMDTLVTDKTGTLTTGEFHLADALDADGAASDEPRRLGLLATTLDLDAGGEPTGDALDLALFRAATSSAAELAGVHQLALLPFDHDRRRVTVLSRSGAEAPLVITKGAPESVLPICRALTRAQQDFVDRQLGEGGRVLAVAVKAAPGAVDLAPADESGLTFAGLLVFDDPAKPGVAEALSRLAALDIQVVIASGDSVAAAARLARDVGLGSADDVPLSGADLERLSDAELVDALRKPAVLARVSPDQKARIVHVLRRSGRAVGFLGDGVNDALALHEADVGISVDTAAEVARDAADVVLLEKSLDVVADGIAQGRRIFANTIKYVLMGTSSNFGNILSASAASALLPFLPLLPTQLLLNNLLYDSSQLAIPTDRVDDDQLRRPEQWDIGVIRRFMLTFGPLSSLFDFLTFGILLGPFHADAALFRSGWFVESLVTQTLVVYSIRTRQVPFLRSRPSPQLTASTLIVVAIALYLPLSPVAHTLGFVAPSLGLYLALGIVAVVFLALIDTAKNAVFDAATKPPAPSHHERRIQRRAGRFTSLATTRELPGRDRPV